MSIIGGLDLPRAPIAFDRVDRDRGQAHRGRMRPATRAARRAWLDGLPGGRGGFAVAGWTGWRFVVEELPAAGFLAHLAGRVRPGQTGRCRAYRTGSGERTTPAG
jgi:transposase